MNADAHPGEHSPADLKSLGIGLLSSPTDVAQAAESLLRGRYQFADADKAETLVALGGDGFMLQTLHGMLEAGCPKPVFGLSRGTVGFLMNDWRLDHLPERIAAAKAIRVAPLEMRATTVGGETFTYAAINEVSLLRETAVSSGRIAPDQRRGRNGLIGVSASIFAASGRIGPRADRL